MLRAIGIVYFICMGCLALALLVGAVTERRTVSYATLHLRNPDPFYTRQHITDLHTGVTFARQPTADQHISWSPDGTHYVAAQSNTALALASANTRTAWQLLGDLSLHTRQMPLWSPDGSGFVFTESTSSVNFQLLYYELATGTITRVGSAGVVERPRNIAWLPDSQRLVMRANLAASNASFAIVDIHQPDTPEYLPMALNGYERILPLADGTGYLLLGGWEIAYVPVDDLTSPVTLHDGHAAYAHLALAPDDSHLAFVSQAVRGYNNQWALTIMDRNTGALREVFRTDGSLQGLHWSSDSTWLLFTHTPRRARSFDTHAVRVDGRGLRQVTSFVGLNTAEWRP